MNMTKDLDAAMPAIVMAAEHLEKQGFHLVVIADALLAVAVTIGAGTTGERATAAILDRLSRRFSAEADQQIID